MKKWMLIALLFPALYATGQPGFNNTYGFEPNLTSSTFSNVILDGDTLVLFGTAHPLEPPFLQGLLFVKMDTLGNVLLQKFYPDPDADKYAASPNFEIIKTLDGGYALTGTNINSGHGILVKLSFNGEIEFYRKYDPAPDLTHRPRKLLEVEDGYLLSGHKSMQNYDIQIFLMKVDKQGNFLWEKVYGQSGVTEVMGSLVKIDDNHFAIGAGKSKIAPSPPYHSGNTWAKAWLIEVDSLGNVFNSTESQLNVQTGLGGLKKMPNGWLYTSAIFEIHNQFEFGTRGTIVRTGENINDVQWERVVGTTSTYLNGMIDIKPTPDGNWVAVGQWATPIPPPPDFGPNYLGGSTFKFTSDGDSLWARLDTAFWHPDCGSENYLGGVAVLPSGSIIAAGYANSNCFPPTPRSYAWVIKISKDGCIDTLCITTDLKIEPHIPQIVIYPNPTTGIVTIRGCENCGAEIYDTLGRLIQKSQLNNHYIDLSSLVNGSYILKIINQEKIIKVEKIIKGH